MRSAACAALLFSIFGACDASAPPRPQLLIEVSTDAPTPELGDRLLLELIDPGGTPCTDCEYILGVAAPSVWPVSFGVVMPAHGGPAYARARLFRSEAVGSDGAPLDSAYVEGLISVTTPTAVTTLSLHLPMTCFGIASDVASGKTCDPVTRELVPAPQGDSGPPLVLGSFAPSAVNVPPAPKGMIAIPGGLMLLGSTDAPFESSDLQPVPERLAILTSFAMDEDEVTVGQVRGLLQSGVLPTHLAPAVKDSNPLAFGAACTFLGDDDGTNDSDAVNCVAFETAEAVCTALEKRLPTEAEWEFAARNRTSRSTYPWGEDEDVCSHAVVGFGRNVDELIGGEEDTTCRTMGAAFGPRPGGSAEDVTLLGVQNLAGNMSEWVEDEFERYDGTFWSAGTPALTNPTCSGNSQGHQGERSVRGGSWAESPTLAVTAERSSLASGGASPYLGFRCAKSL